MNFKGRPTVSPFLLYLTLSVAVAACNQHKASTPQNARNQLRDDLGTLVSVHPHPHRIVSLAPSITESLFALGLDSSIVGVTDYCDFPPQAKQKESVGGMANPSFERIAELNPDLVLMSVAGNSRADYDKLVGLGFRVFVTNPSSIDGIAKSIQNIGVLSGKQREADSLLAMIPHQRGLLRETAAERPRRRVLMLLSLRPVIAVGGKTFLNEMLTLANATNVAAEAPTSYPMLSRERVLELQPEFILVMNDVAGSTDDVRNAFPEWRSLDAFRNNRVVILNANTISRPGPRIINGLEQIVTALHENN